MSKQQILEASEHYTELDQFFLDKNIKRVFLVCGKSFNNLRLKEHFDHICENRNIEIVRFGGFSPNPRYEDIAPGVDLFKTSDCDCIVAVGGGSAMDVAKCIKLFSNMDSDINYLQQEIVANDIPFLAVPTTSGTGSEATRFAVIYYKGNKQSVTHVSCIPDTVLMDSSALTNLPEYQRKVTMLDALCHAIESYWSVNSTEESKEYSRIAIELILSNLQAYINNEPIANRNMLEASFVAGKAINITQTTAGHAMCYKLTTLYGISHGYAAALCVQRLFPYMLEHIEDCIDPRGADYLRKTFEELARCLGGQNTLEAVDILQSLVAGLNLETPIASKDDFDILDNSVNPDRLKNNPVALDMEAIDYLYHQIVRY